MYTEKDFSHLHTLWDGKADNANTLCAACGACCHNNEKTLFPGEYEYALKITGQNNPSWCSPGCLCYSTKDLYKPIICRIFPLSIEVTLETHKILWEDPTKSVDSKNCLKLIYTKAQRELADAYVDYLFSDIHNRLFYLFQFSLQENIDQEKKFVKSLGKKMPPEDIMERAIYTTLGINIKNYFSHYKNV